VLHIVQAHYREATLLNVSLVVSEGILETVAMATGPLSVVLLKSVATNSGLVPGANGALRDPLTGRFAANPDTVPRVSTGGVNGNSLSSPRPATLYARYSSDRTFQKWGITQDLNARYSPSELDGGFLRPIGSGPRWIMANMERNLTMQVPGPKNFEAWARAASG